VRPDVAERCRQLGLLRMDPVTLVGIVRQGLGQSEQVEPETAAQIGRVLSLDNFEARVPDPDERQELRSRPQKLSVPGRGRKLAIGRRTSRSRDGQHG